MKKSLKIISTLITALTTTGLVAWFAVAQAAGSATLTLTPASGSYENGASFSVVIHESSSDQINAVQANLTYDQSKLQFVSIDTSGSTFNYSLASSGGSGSVSIARGISNGGTVTGNQTVGSVTFKVLVGSGSSQVTFASSSAIIRPSDGANVWNGSPTGATYSFTQPVQPSTPPATTTPPPSTPSTPVATTTQTSTAQAASAAAQAANPEAPVAVSNDIAINAGYPVAIKVVAGKDKAVQNASVTLNDQSAKTDATGIASFNDIPAGKYKVSVKANGKTVTSNIIVESSKPFSEVQEFKIQLKAGRSFIVWEIAAGIIIMLLLLRIVRMMRSKGFHSFKNTPSQIIASPSPTPTASTIISPDPPQSSPTDEINKQP